MQERDSIFGEQVLWSGTPKVVTVPSIYRAGSIVSGIIAVVTLASAFLVSRALGAPVGGLMVFAAWMTALAVGLQTFPRWWRSKLEYSITERNIVLRRGKLRRFIDRRSISFARIHWHPTLPGIGDLEIVRAVPTGALRRRLSIVLTGVVAPDRVWAIARGIIPSTPAGDGQRPLTQRLDDGERVLWSAHPGTRWRKWVPVGWRGAASLGVGAVLSAVAVVTLVRALNSVDELLSAGLDPASASFYALVVSVALTVLLLVAAAVVIVYSVMVRPARMESRTRYLITDRRVLIQCGDMELHLDRSNIVDVIESPAERGRHNLFLVLDGPRAQALASGGAFGEEPGQGLQPVLHMIADADAVTRLLRDSVTAHLPLAA